MNSDPKLFPVLLQRWLLLLGLAIGLTVFLLWLPGDVRTALWIGLVAQRSLVVMFVCFVLIALSLLWSTGQHADSYIFMLLNRHGYRSQQLDGLMWLITQLGSMWMGLIAAFLFFLLRYHSLAVEIILGTMTLWLMVEAIKLLTDRSRPFLVLEGTRIIGPKESGRSFPSGHTSQIFFMAALLSHQLKPDSGQVIALYLIALLVGFTRIYVGAHYPRDVLGGMLLGSVWGVMLVLIDPYLFWVRL
jgi:membrane-associated phospholipid phosphatase